MKNPFKCEELNSGLVENTEHLNDPRNVLYDDLEPLGGVLTLPSEYRLTESSWTLYQGGTSSCTCHAAVHALNVATGRELSPRHAFWKIKTQDKYPSKQLGWGAYTKDAIAAIIEGVSSYKYAPNDNIINASDKDYLAFEENAANIQSAKEEQGGSYVYVAAGSASEEEMFDKVCRFIFTERLPVLIGMRWYSAFNKAAKKTGYIPAVAPTGSQSGHLVTAVGWQLKDGVRYLVVKNSFGSWWGDHGYTYIPVGFKIITSAVAIIPKTVLVIPPKLEEPRDVLKEKLIAASLRKEIYEKFPITSDIPVAAYDANMIARSLAGRMWLTLVPAVTYRGWTNTDVINYLYAQSRKKTDTKAYTLDFSKQK